jgi:hypothetical protein
MIRGGKMRLGCVAVADVAVGSLHQLGQNRSWTQAVRASSGEIR